MMPQPLFAPFQQQFEIGVNAAVSSVITSALQAIAPELTTALLIFIIIQGMLISFRRYDYWMGLTNIARATCVTLLLSAGYYATWIQSPFMTTIPNWIAHVVNGGDGPLAGAQQFDAVLSATEHFAASILKQTTLWDVGARINIGIAMLADLIALGIAFVIWELSSLMMGLMVCLGPFVLIGMLFSATRSITQQWISKLIGLLVLQLMISVLLQLIISGNNEYLRQAQAAPGAGIDEEIQTLFDIVAFAGMSAVIAILVPSVAAYIGGGVSLNVVGKMFQGLTKLAVAMRLIPKGA
jgi:type IV secretion system protein VirB6